MTTMAGVLDTCRRRGRALPALVLPALVQPAERPLLFGELDAVTRSAPMH